MIRLLIALCCLSFLPAYAQASPDGHLLFGTGLSRYWYGFRDFWYQQFGSAGGVVMIALAAGTIGIMIIISGKWIK